jgi:hypothetical protein
MRLRSDEVATTRSINVPISAVYEDGTRVLLVRPGDVLLIGNIGEHVDPTAANAAVETLRKETGVKVFLFRGDIDIAKLPADA